jgi:putative copper export protein
VNHDDLPLPIDLYALGRGVAYAATLMLIGACAFAVLVPRWRRTGDDDRSLAARSLAGAWRVASLAAILLLLAHLLRAWGQVRSFLDPAESFTWEAAQPVLFSTTWGRGWLAQLAAAALTLPLTLLAPRRPALGLALLGSAAVAVAGTSPLTGHAVEHPWGAGLGVGLHALHLLGGGLWLGTLFTMFRAGLVIARDADATDVAEMVAAFSPLALVGAALAVGAGFLLAFAYIGEFAALWGTSYGRALLIKLCLLATALGFGAWNWRRVRPRLGSPAATVELRRSAGLELLVGLALIAVTAVLVALPAPKL